jgi:hypothetical protein
LESFRAFPSYDAAMYNTAMADRLLRWLDDCGYQIVEKDSVQLSPEPADEERQRTPEFH